MSVLGFVPRSCGVSHSIGATFFHPLFFILIIFFLPWTTRKEVGQPMAAPGARTCHFTFAFCFVFFLFVLFLLFLVVGVSSLLSLFFFKATKSSWWVSRWEKFIHSSRFAERTGEGEAECANLILHASPLFHFQIWKSKGKRIESYQLNSFV